MKPQDLIDELRATNRGRQALAALAPLAALWPELDSNHRARMREVIYALETHTGTISDACSAAAQAAQEAADLARGRALLDEMIRSRDFESYISDRLGNDLFINDPNRADRIWRAAEDGADGSTHAEVIDDWRDFLRDVWKDELSEDRDLADERAALIESAIDAAEAWHEANGTLHQEIG